MLLLTFMLTRQRAAQIAIGESVQKAKKRRENSVYTLLFEQISVYTPFFFELQLYPPSSINVRHQLHPDKPINKHFVNPSYNINLRVIHQFNPSVSLMEQTITLGAQFNSLDFRL